jgi:threonine synthase
VVTVTGHGLKDPDWALKDERGRQIKPKKVAATASAVADILGLERNK